MAMSKVGPWRREDYENFIALATEPPPPAPPGYTTLSSLLGLSRESPSDQPTLKLLKFVEKEWVVRQKHPVYKWLLKNQDFRDAWSAFKRIKKRPARQPAPIKLNSLQVELIFLREFVRHAGWAYTWVDSKRSNYGANADRRRAAAKHAKALSQLLSEGVSLLSYTETQRLISTLDSFVEQLEATRRKSYGGVRERARAIQKILARALISDCGLKSPSVIASFARMVGAPCDLKTARRYCAEQEKHWRRDKANALAQALREADNKGPPSG
jgi:hypothetical protein